MLVIHNGTTMFPNNQNPKTYRPGATITKPNGDRVGPVSDGLDLGGGWVVAEVAAADPIPDGEEGISISPQMVGGVPKLVHQTRVITQADIDAKRVLTPARFAYLLAITGLEQVWTDVEAYCKINDPATYALLKAHGAATEFRLTKTLATLATMKPLTDAIAPGVDLSEETIRAAWDQAEAAVI